MYRCVSLNSKNISELKKMSLIKSEFNSLNEDFFEYYPKYNILKKLCQRKRVKLIRKDDKYVAFIWFDYVSKNTRIIRSMFSLEKCNIDVYKLLLESIRGNFDLKYNCRSNGYNLKLLECLGFVKKNGLVEFCLSEENLNKLEYIHNSTLNGMSFKIFEKGKDEGLRCFMQNSIFEDEKRVPLSLKDIFYDVSQSYFIDSGSLFLYKGYDCIGYGQIILDRGCPYIVNLGILNEHRGKGYSKVLLTRLLRIIKEMGFKEVRLTVKSDNLKAANLYKGFGFIKEFETSLWEIKR